MAADEKPSALIHASALLEPFEGYFEQSKAFVWTLGRPGR
jgi:hypothetical protein